MEDAIATAPESKTEAWAHLTIEEKARIQGLKATQVVEKEVQVTDPWLSDENLEAIASDLIDCPDQETLAALRECWPGYAMNAACKLLPVDKHTQVKEWVVNLNEKSATEIR